MHNLCLTLSHHYKCGSHSTSEVLTFSVLRKEEYRYHRKRFVCRFPSSADLKMEDNHIWKVTHCVWGQQGVKQPIKWKQRLHAMKNNHCSQNNELPFDFWPPAFQVNEVKPRLCFGNLTDYFLSAFITVYSWFISSLIVSILQSRWVRRHRTLFRQLLISSGPPNSSPMCHLSWSSALWGKKGTKLAFAGRTDHFIDHRCPQDSRPTSAAKVACSNNSPRLPSSSAVPSGYSQVNITPKSRKHPTVTW